MTDQNTSSELALTTLLDAAAMIEKYARRTMDSKKAQTFSTQLSVMAQREPKLKDCTPASIVTAMMACVELDLMPNTPQQHAHLIPYSNYKTKKMEVQFQIGFKGLLELVRRTGQIAYANVELVYAGDIFDVDLGTERRLTHKPNFSVDRTDYEKVTHAYMTARLVSGETTFEVMTKAELNKIRDFAKAISTEAPWQKWAPEMAKKTVIKRATKLLPSSTQDQRLARAIELDSWAEAGKMSISNGEIIEGETVDAQTAQDRRSRMIAADNKRKELAASDHTPAPVETAEEA